ncbi:MAG: 6-bladed beta-propeller [Gemmatimonadota bacterium]|nr:6-bladed beta-propeller [Gemmatimonadota bacterium]
MTSGFGKGMGCFALALALNGCGDTAGGPSSGAGGVWDLDPESRWQLTESLRIGDLHGEGPAAFGEVRCLAVDPMDRIWVVDELAEEMRVFGADGSFVRTVGRRGEGPGEFRRIADVFPGPEQEIWVEDRVGRRYEIFDTAGTRIGGHPTALANVGNARRSWTRQGLLVVRDPITRTVGFFERVEGELRDTGREAAPPNTDSLAQPVEPPASLRFESAGPIAGSTSGRIPFTPRVRGFFGSDLDRWEALQIATDRYEIRRRSLETGDILLAVTHRYEPAAIPDSMRKAAADSVVDRYTQGGSKLVTDFDWTMVPQYYPAFEGFHVSAGGDVWVRRTVAGGLIGFDVFAPDGRFLGQPTVSVDLGRMRVQVITENSLYAIDTDDLGVEYVVRFDIAGVGEDRVAARFMTGCDSF